jgi:hypothetical protein
MDKQLYVLARNPHDGATMMKLQLCIGPFIMASNDINATAAAINKDVEAEELWCVMEKKVAVDALLEWVHGEDVPPSVP